MRKKKSFVILKHSNSKKGVIAYLNNIKLAENLVYLRRKKGVTQETVADFLGITKASVSKWETGISLPDIAQLPKLASYYDISIDELMGYEAQISMEVIKMQYEAFAEDFAKRKFSDVMEDIRNFIRQYYSCYPALLHMVVLLLNHYKMAEEEEQPNILQEMVQLCEHIQEKSIDANLCVDANVLQATIELLQGKAEEAIQKLQPFYQRRSLKEGSEGILIQAYQMTGQIEEALEWNQVHIFTHLLSLVENSILYLLANLNNKEVAIKTIERIQKIIEAYELHQLHPNSYLKFQYVKAMFYAMYDRKQEALEALEIFVEDGISFVKNALYLHGDSYFDRLDNHFKKIEEYTILPRNKQTVLESIKQDLEHPIFQEISRTEQFKQMKEMIYEECKKL